MKKIVSISLGSGKHDYKFNTKFMGQKFHITHVGTDGDMEKASALLKDYEDEADAIGLGGVRFPSSIGLKRFTQNRAIKLQELSSTIKVPVTTGDAFRKVAQAWVLRYVQFELGDYFNNARVLFLSGINNYTIAQAMAEFTDNISFADLVYENKIPKFIKSIKDLERYAKGADFLELAPTKFLSSTIPLVKEWNQHVIKKAMQNASTIVVPFYDFYKNLEDTTIEELGGKTIITATAYEDRIDFLKDRGVDMIIDATPQILERVVGVNVLEAMIIAALDKSDGKLSDDDLLEVISDQNIHPRILYPSGQIKKKARFAFVIHPLSQAQLQKDSRINAMTKISPIPIMDAVEKIMAYAPPFVYSKVTGIKSPTGAEAEGWLITVGGTPKQMLSHPPEFTYKRLLEAAKMAKRLGAQIMGLGAFTKVVGDAGKTVAKLADIPITTGNSYSSSGALWAATDAARRMGLIKEAESGKKLKAKSMVIGSTGAIGSVCCRLLAMAFEELYIVGRNNAKLLALKESILKETPKAKIIMTTRADKYLGDMDVIVTATSAAGKKILDIMKVKPGCVITDVARPLDLSAEDVALRPDVLVIESGEIELPGNPQMKDIGLPPRMVYACLAETIVLALEGRFEIFTIGRDIEWQKVKEIFKLGLKHGMKLAAISGINGAYSDEDIQKVKKLALEARAKLKGKKPDQSHKEIGKEQDKK